MIIIKIRNRKNWIDMGNNTYVLCMEFDSFGLDYYFMAVIKRTSEHYCNYRGFVTNGYRIMPTEGSYGSLVEGNDASAKDALMQDLEKLKKKMKATKFKVCDIEKATHKNSILEETILDTTEQAPYKNLQMELLP